MRQARWITLNRGSVGGFLVVVTALIVLAGITSPATAGEPTETRQLEPLWSRYPLAPQQRGAQPPIARTTTGPARANDQRQGGLPLTVLLPVIFVGLAGACAAAMMIIGQRGSVVSERKGAVMSVFRRNRGRSDARDTGWSDEAEHHADAVARIRAATAASEEAAVAADAGGSSNAELADNQQRRKLASASPGQIGEHVAGLLQSAEEAARKIREQTQRDADALLDRARREADEVRAQAAREVKNQKADAAKVVSESDKASKKTREAADAYAERVRRDADRRAVELVAESQAKAASIAQSATERHETLLANVSITEDRLRTLSSALRDVARELDDVVADGDGPEKGPDERRRLDESLREQAEASAATRPSRS